jgi:hypothetical protein
MLESFLLVGRRDPLALEGLDNGAAHLQTPWSPPSSAELLERAIGWAKVGRRRATCAEGKVVNVEKPSVSIPAEGGAETPAITGTASYFGNSMKYSLIKACAKIWGGSDSHNEGSTVTAQNAQQKQDPIQQSRPATAGITTKMTKMLKASRDIEEPKSDSRGRGQEHKPIETR